MTKEKKQKFGIKIRNYEAGSIYEYHLGVRDYLDSKKAMLSNSLFVDFLMENGINVKNDSTRDIICINFNYGSASYKDQARKLKKSYEEMEKISDPDVQSLRKEKLDYISSLLEKRKDQYEKRSVKELRIKFYEEGVTIPYFKIGRNKQSVLMEEIHYRMLYRTPGKAKVGSCMFIRDELYESALRFLRMGIDLPEDNAPIVEIGAYQSLITSSIVGRIRIRPEEILVIEDVDSYMTADVTGIKVNEDNECFSEVLKDYQLKNTMFDGQALIDESIFPEWGEGYVLLRQHFTKCAAFCTRIQKFYRDYFGDDYENAVVKDYWGRKIPVRQIKLITTENALKFLKFGISFDYWADWVRRNGSLFGIVKTAHESKLGELQQMSYQYINALDIDSMQNVVRESTKYVLALKNEDWFFLDYLRRNANFANDYEVLAALVDNDPDFVYCDYFKQRRRAIINGYIKKFKNGKVLQNADNLVIVGSPYAMLLHSVGEDVEKDNTFEVEEEAIQCYSERFRNDEYLAEFRSPFNSRSNLGYLHNRLSPTIKKYFVLGKQCIAVNMRHSNFQDKNNGLMMGRFWGNPVHKLSGENWKAERKRGIRLCTV